MSAGSKSLNDYPSGSITTGIFYCFYHTYIPYSIAVVLAMGVNGDGRRGVSFLSEFLFSLKQRLLSGVRLVISDAQVGLTKVILLQWVPKAPQVYEMPMVPLPYRSVAAARRAALLNNVSRNIWNDQTKGP